ncbi:hypothetical protein BDZ91DRAFT_666153 [Kalaharituber pfeilii]|nr:hypothetical protein BDZ91DRAFT_666153 [Kalaharituber pfeilii]
MFPSLKDIHGPSFPKQKIPFAWPSIPALVVPHRMRRKLRSQLRSRQSPASYLASLQTSWSPKDTIRALRSHRWSLYDGQYLILIIIGIFCLSIIEFPGPLIKTAIATLLMVSLLLPITRQFFLPFLPIVAWLVLFYACRFIPVEYRPPIWVRVLPALENIVYGANLSNILSAHKNTALDILAWLPYGIIHFAAPFLTGIALFVFAAPGTVATYSRSFGYLNIIGVVIQIIFPCAPPWYEAKYGLQPANYSMSGSPAGLARIDALFGKDIYTTNFSNAPVVFGAMPSLHAGQATINALFLAHVFPRAKYLFYSYILWIWWATLYLQHHYAVDLIAGSVLSLAIFQIAKTKFLARLQPDKMTRWDYDYTEIGNAPETYGLHRINTDYHFDSDEWTVGSSSSISSATMSITDETQSLWDEETLGSPHHSDVEVVDVIVDERR